MKIKDGFKVREIAGERVLIIQGRSGADMTKLITMNSTAEWLFAELGGKEFETPDVARMLKLRFGIDMQVAETDAAIWVADMVKCGVIE